MLVDVEDGRLAGVRGDPDNPDSRGFLCIRGHAAREIIGNPQRLLHPMRRAARSGAWQRVTWDDALDAIAESALDRKIGARGLRMIIEELMLDLMYQVPNQKKVREVTITREVVLAKDKPITLIEKAG